MCFIKEDGVELEFRRLGYCAEISMVNTGQLLAGWQLLLVYCRVRAPVFERRQLMILLDCPGLLLRGIYAARSYYERTRPQTV